MSKIVGVVPAAGRGTRLQPLPIPKELFPIGYQEYVIHGEAHRRPKVVSQYVVEAMADAGAERLVFILGEGKHQLMEYYGSGARFGVDCAYVYQEQLSGMPGALALTQSLTQGALVLFGMPDTIFEPVTAYSTVVAAHHERRADVTLGLFPTAYPQKFGMVDFSADGTIRRIVDKPPASDLRFMWGIAVWGDRFAAHLADYVIAHRAGPAELLLGDVFVAASAAGLNVRACPFEQGSYFDIGTPDELDEMIRRFHF